MDNNEITENKHADGKNVGNENKKILKRAIMVLCAVVIAAGSFAGGFFFRNAVNPDYASLDFILQHYKKYYLEEKDDYVTLMANGLLADDIYSEYYRKDDYEVVVKAAQGIRGGIGLTFYSGSTYIYEVKNNSPADRAGIAPGGSVIGIKGKDDEFFVETDSLSALNEELNKYDLGDVFDVKIQYGTEVSEYELAREEYRETYINYEDENGLYKFIDEGNGLTFKRVGDGSGLIAGDAAYLRYSSFNGTGKDSYASANQVSAALEKFREDGRKKIIIDLRNNGGGYMDIMQSVVSHFVGGKNGERKIISIARKKDGSEEKFRSEKSDYADYSFESIIILANANTASAAEAFIGAVLDYDERNVVKVVLEKSGSGVYRTYGKGIMQTTFERFGTGEAIKLTTAKIYWPISDVCIHGVGVTDNIERYADKIYNADVKEGDYALDYAISLL